MRDEHIEDLIQELQALRLRETAIIAQLEQEVLKGSETHRAHQTETTRSRSTTLKRGDRVRITNKIRKPATADETWRRDKEELATVTKVTKTQVHITTDNGTETWRAPNNLRLI